MRLKIRAVSEHGFWRCGTHFPQAGQIYPEGTFTPGQVAVLKAEKMLVVEEDNSTTESAESALIRAELITIADSADNKNDAKDALEAWGLERLAFNVSKSLKLEAVVDALVVEWGNQNPSKEK